MFGKKSKWIGCGDLSTPIVLKTIETQSPKKAVLNICGLGYYELFINGRRVSEEFFKPVLSDYRDRDFSTYGYPLFDKTSHTVYYNRYDITSYLQSGGNTIAVMLGNGFYRQKGRTCEGDTSFGEELLLRFELSLTDKTGTRDICTDGTEKIVKSFITENNLFYGETHDYAAFDFLILTGGKAAEVFTPEVLPDFQTKFLKQRCKNDKIIRESAPIIVSKQGDKTIYDAGINLSGFVRMKPKSDCVRIRHAENLKDGALDFESAGGDWQISENVYRNAQGREVHPWFSWSGFRYFEIEGEAEDIVVCTVHTPLKIQSEFECGNETINWLYSAYVQTQLCNMHGGVPSDCPHRERLGYTGDGQLTAETAMLTLNSRAFYDKWLWDIADCQDIESGHVQHTAPFLGGGGGPGGWGGAMVIVPYVYYKIYGDTRVIKKYFGNMQEFLRSMHGFTENGLVVKEREKGWCLGDWCTPEKVILPEPFVNTFYYVRCMEFFQTMAAAIGKKVDYQAEIDLCKRAMQERYFDDKTGNYCDGVQGANAFALSIGLGDKRTKENLLAHYRDFKAFDTGIFGTDILTEYLTSIGEIQLLYDLLSSNKYPSFGAMKAQGATTIWESWSGDASHNHPMFGGCVRQLFYGLLGITADVGCKNITVAPKYIDGIGFIRAKLRFPQGTLRVCCQYKDGKVFTQYKASGKIKVSLKK
ncbi:MAG: family 78 glycoside hydrolase catalytic domain [Clostridia bacterium]|nr:family 78 glycoside hydrolase catalytic domain [Clostridia bacterium]